MSRLTLFKHFLDTQRMVTCMKDLLLEFFERIKLKKIEGGDTVQYQLVGVYPRKKMV